MPALSAFVAFQIQNVCMYICTSYGYVPMGYASTLRTVAILKEYYSCKFNHSKVGRARKKPCTLLMAFTGICWQERNAEAEDSLGPISETWPHPPVPCWPEAPALLSRSFCFISPLMVPCSLLSRCPSQAQPWPHLPLCQLLCSVPPPSRGQSTSAHPSQLGLEGASSSTWSWRGAAGLARTCVFCGFCRWSLSLSWAYMIGNHLNLTMYQICRNFHRTFRRHILRERTGLTCLNLPLQS